MTSTDEISFLIHQKGETLQLLQELQEKAISTDPSLYLNKHLNICFKLGVLNHIHCRLYDDATYWYCRGISANESSQLFKSHKSGLCRVDNVLILSKIIINLSIILISQYRFKSSINLLNKYFSLFNDNLKLKAIVQDLHFIANLNLNYPNFNHELFRIPMNHNAYYLYNVFCQEWIEDMDKVLLSKKYDFKDALILDQVIRVAMEDNTPIIIKEYLIVNLTYLFKSLVKDKKAQDIIEFLTINRFQFINDIHLFIIEFHKKHFHSEQKFSLIYLRLVLSIFQKFSKINRVIEISHLICDGIFNRLSQYKANQLNNNNNISSKESMFYINWILGFMGTVYYYLGFPDRAIDLFKFGYEWFLFFDDIFFNQFIKNVHLTNFKNYILNFNSNNINLSNLCNGKMLISPTREYSNLIDPNLKIVTNLIFCLNSSSNVSLNILYKYHTVYKDMIIDNQSSNSTTFKKKDQKCIGFISSDLKNHSVSFFLYSLFKYSQNQQIVVYSVTKKEDEISAILKKLVVENGNIWKHFSLDFSDNTDAIINDIHNHCFTMIDINGFSGDCTHSKNILVLLKIPIINYLGYCNTTGGIAKYRIVDKITDPINNPNYSEDFIYLKNSFICYSNTLLNFRKISHENSKEFKYCCFSNFSKVSDNCLMTYLTILIKDTKNSKLLLRSDASKYIIKYRIIPMLNKLNVENPCEFVENRIEFLPSVVDRNDHLVRYREAGLVLDTFPYSGTTTTCEALMMGIPVLTLVTEADDQSYLHANRVSYSILRNSQLGVINNFNCVVTDQDDFINQAIKAQDVKFDNEWISRKFLNSPMCDGESFSKGFYDCVCKLSVT